MEECSQEVEASFLCQLGLVGCRLYLGCRATENSGVPIHLCPRTKSKDSMLGKACREDKGYSLTSTELLKWGYRSETCYCPHSQLQSFAQRFCLGEARHKTAPNFFLNELTSFGTNHGKIQASGCSQKKNEVVVKGNW